MVFIRGPFMISNSLVHDFAITIYTTYSKSLHDNVSIFIAKKVFSQWELSIATWDLKKASKQVMIVVALQCNK